MKIGKGVAPNTNRVLYIILETNEIIDEFITCDEYLIKKLLE